MDIDEDLKELFFTPENYNIIPFPNIWNAESVSPGMFKPVFQPPLSPFGEFLVGVDPYSKEGDENLGSVTIIKKHPDGTMYYSVYPED